MVCPTVMFSTCVLANFITVAFRCKVATHCTHCSMDVISLLQRLSSHKAAGTSSAQHVPAVDDTHNVVRIAPHRAAQHVHIQPTQDDEELPFEERERRRQFGGARRPAPPPSQPLASPPPSKPVAETKQQQLVQLPKRANKNRPVEQSSKKAVPRFRDVLQAGNKGPADPRFARDAEEPADRSSTKELWRKRYAFVFDELLPKEKEEAQRAMSVRFAADGVGVCSCLTVRVTEGQERAHQGGAAGGAAGSAGADAGRARSAQAGRARGQAAGALFVLLSMCEW